jgi:replicative DNA helicase
MTKDKLTRRLLALETKISNDKLKVGRLDNNEWEHLDERLKAIVNTKIYIDDSPNLCLKELIYRSKKLYYQKNIDLIIIDYLELLKSDNSKNETSNNKFQREFELTCFTRDLKILARELNIPIIILSQLNRGSDSKTQITPSLKDLANGLENHMDVIIFIRRPEMYGFLEDEDGNSLKGIADIKIVKNNDGYIGNFYLRFLEESLSFEEYFEEDVNTIIPPSFGSKMNNNWNGDSPF